MLRNKRKGLLILVVIFLMMVMLVAGCSTEEPDSEPIQEAIEEGAEQLYFGMTIKWPGYPFVQAFMNGAKDKADELGIVIEFADSDDDYIEALNIMDLFIDKGVDAYIHAGTSDELAPIPGFKKMTDAGIHIATIDVLVPGEALKSAGTEVAFHVNPSNRLGGKMAAEAFIEGLKEKHGGDVPEGVVLQIMLDPAILWSQLIDEGFSEVIQQYPQITVVQGVGGFDANTANATVSDLLTRYGDDVIGIFTQTVDLNGMGAVSAVRSQGLNPEDFLISGYYISPEIRDAMLAGEVFVATYGAAYESGYLVVQYLYNKITGGPVPSAGDKLIQEGEAWSPAEVLDYPGYPGHGVYIQLATPTIGLGANHEIHPEDSRLWINKMDDWGELK